MADQGVDACAGGGLVAGAGHPDCDGAGLVEAEIADSSTDIRSPVEEAKPTAEGHQDLDFPAGQEAEGAAPSLPRAAEDNTFGEPSTESPEAGTDAGEESVSPSLGEEVEVTTKRSLPHSATAPVLCSVEGASREAPHPSVKPQTSYAASKAAQNATAAAQRAAAVAAFASEMWEKMNAKLADMPGVKVAAEYLNVSPLVVTSSAIVCFLGFLLFGLGGQLVCTVVGALYPAFESFKVVESGDPKLMEFWLNYWVVYAMLSSIEYVGYYMFVWLPFYFPLKLGFLLWLVSPSTGGVRYTYRWFVSPILHRNRENIDSVLEQSSTKLKTGIKSAAKGALETGLGSAKGAGALGLSKLKLGLQLVRPSVGNMASFAMEAALSATARSRSSSGKGEKECQPAEEGEKDRSQVPLLKSQEEETLPPPAIANCVDSEPEPEMEDEKAATRLAPAEGEEEKETEKEAESLSSAVARQEEEILAPAAVAVAA